MRILEGEKNKLIKISRDLELVILCIVKILVMRNVKQPSLILAPVSLGLSASVLAGLGSKLSQVQILGLKRSAYLSIHKHSVSVCVYVCV